jgi:hypothetical protein
MMCRTALSSISRPLLPTRPQSLPTHTPLTALSSRSKSVARVPSNSVAVEDSLVAALLAVVVAWADKAVPVEVSSHAAVVVPPAALGVVLPRRRERDVPAHAFFPPFLLCLS